MGVVSGYLPFGGRYGLLGAGFRFVEALMAGDDGPKAYAGGWWAIWGEKDFEKDV